MSLTKLQRRNCCALDVIVCWLIDDKMIAARVKEKICILANSAMMSGLKVDLTELKMSSSDGQVSISNLKSRGRTI